MTLKDTETMSNSEVETETMSKTVVLQSPNTVSKFSDCEPLGIFNICQLFNVHVSKRNRGLTGIKNVVNLRITVALDLTKFT